MRKITDYNEFLKIWELNHKNRYWGNKRISKEEEAIIIDKANLKDFKRYNIYMLDDDYYLVFDTKPIIESVLYYDDETPEPEKCLNYFIDYNLKSNFKYDLSKWLDEINSLKTI